MGSAVEAVSGFCVGFRRGCTLHAYHCLSARMPAFNLTVAAFCPQISWVRQRDLHILTVSLLPAIVCARPA